MRGLLDKDKSYLDIASGFFGREKKKSKKRRFVQLLDFALNLGDRVMTNRANENLMDLQNEKVFELAKANDNWLKYSKVIDAENSYRNNPNHFRQLAVQDFYNQYGQDYLTRNDIEAAKDFFETEVAQNAAGRLRMHEEQKAGLTKGEEIDLTLTKEEFLKPLEDYYRGKEREITDPANRSVIHKGLSFLGVGKKRRANVAKEIADAEAGRNAAISKSYGFHKPVALTAEEAIEVRRASSFEYTRDEAAALIRNQGLNEGLEQRVIQNLTEDTYTRGGILAAIRTSTIDYNPVLVKREQYGEAFDTSYQEEFGAIPQKGEPEYRDYISGRRDYIDLSTGSGDSEMIKIRNLIRERNSLDQDSEEYKIINNRLNSLSRNKVLDGYVENWLFTYESDDIFKDTIDTLAEEKGVGWQDILQIHIGNFVDGLEIADSIVNRK